MDSQTLSNETLYKHILNAHLETLETELSEQATTWETLDSEQLTWATMGAAIPEQATTWETLDSVISKVVNFFKPLVNILKSAPSKIKYYVSALLPKPLLIARRYESPPRIYTDKHYKVLLPLLIVLSSVITPNAPNSLGLNTGVKTN